MEKKRKSFLGRVLNSKMDKTVVVEVENRRAHPRYHKVLKYKTTFMVHDEGRMCSAGDLVKIAESRPLSRMKRWRVVEVVSKAEVIEVKPEEIE